VGAGAGANDDLFAKPLLTGVVIPEASQRLSAQGVKERYAAAPGSRQALRAFRDDKDWGFGLKVATN
jgi:hypothetical protein